MFTQTWPAPGVPLVTGAGLGDAFLPKIPLSGFFAVGLGTGVGVATVTGEVADTCAYEVASTVNCFVLATAESDECSSKGASRAIPVLNRGSEPSLEAVWFNPRKKGGQFCKETDRPGKPETYFR